ncbi:tetratricopeptide repeat protein [Clostridium tyrobutyricum]|jgi:tetratricopeptide (TPR) repeat protein|uniref:tetratricopeptide repeat protein n=1 Tax=Clostridium tyrobutyricum TaxID=1519 RepID=UPI000E9E4A0D|nr:tetratricopeptide repeat protein [Clostridium tyrobutyricum]HBF76733.1 hypothetical protein [Clostridiaceae bacterium]
MINKAFYYCLKGDYESAISAYTKKIKNKKGTSKDLYNLGLCYIKIKNWEKANECFKEAFESKYQLNNNIQISQCFFNLGYTYEKLNEFKKAFLCYKAALAYNSDDIECAKIVADMEKQLSFC